MEAQKVETSNGWLWVKQGYTVFKKSPVLWMVLTVVAAIILIGMASIPIVGDPLATLLLPVLLAGFMFGCRALEQGKDLEIAYLFAGFRYRAQQLVALGGINMVSQLLILGVMKMMGGGVLVGLIMSGEPVDDPSMLAQALDGTVPAIMIGMILYFILVAAMQFAPALVLFKETEPVQAMMSSLRACLRNIMPLSVYGAAMLLLAMPATMLMMLGWLVLLPVMMTSNYAAFWDLFPEVTKSAEIAAAREADQNEQNHS